MSIRRRALEALEDIADRGAYSNLRLKKAQAGLEARDAAFVSALVYTALDNLSYIDYALGAYAKGRIHGTIRNILRLGITQAVFMSVPESAACNESVKLTREVGKAALSGYVNAVMRTVCREGMPVLPADEVAALSIRYGYGEFIIREYIERYGLDFTRELLGAKTTGCTVRAQYPFTSAMLERALRSQGIEYARGELDDEAFKLADGFNIAADPLFVRGDITIQGESAMYACRALNVAPGMRILDCCCAPGGKSAYIASIMQNTGAVIGWDVHEHRVELTNNTLERLHVNIARASVRDASVYDASFASSFDAVLVDAPCSGLGITGKPDVRYGVTEQSVKELALLQSAILDACAAYVKPGGRLVYSTCTVSRLENEAQAEGFLKKHGEFYAVEGWTKDSLRHKEKNGGIQLFANTDGVEGFYIAVFERKAK